MLVNVVKIGKCDKKYKIYYQCQKFNNLTDFYQFLPQLVSTFNNFYKFLQKIYFSKPY